MNLNNLKKVSKFCAEIIVSIVGIGTTGPSTQLHLYSTTPQMTLESSTNGNSGVKFTNTAGTLNLLMDSTRGLALNDMTAGPNRLYVAPTGNIGIGDFSSGGPQNKLDIEGSSSIGWNHAVTPVAPTNGLLVNGNVGIGTTGPNDKLQVVGDIRVGTAGSNGCLKDFGGGTITGTCSSDERLKQNFRLLGPVSEKLTQIAPKFYQWRKDEFPERHFGEQEELGLVAQDLLEIIPELVQIDEDGFYRVRYQRLPFYLIKGFAEHQEAISGISREVASQKKKIESLEADNLQIKAENLQLKARLEKSDQENTAKINLLEKKLERLEHLLKNKK